MKKLNTFFFTLASFLPSLAFAQIGPDLRPPGLDPDHPLDKYTKSKSTQVDEASNSSWDLDTGDIVFSAAKKRQLISEAPSTIHVITEKEIAAHGWRSLADILRHVPGVQTQTIHSQFQSVMIRGLVGSENNNSRILWLQNGIPMNDVRDSGFWIDDTYPVEMIKRIEVVLGPGSALYGAGAFQGVVNIFTKDPADIDKYGEYHLTMQNNLTFKASAIAGYNSSNKRFGILGHVSGNTTQGPGLIGDYVYQDYLMSQAGSSVAERNEPKSFRYQNIDSNSDRHWINTNLKITAGDFKINFGYTYVDAGADGSETVPNIAYDQTIAHGDFSTPLTSDESVPTNERAQYRFNRQELYADAFYENAFTDSFSFLSVVSLRWLQYIHKNYGGYKDGGLPDLLVIDTNGKKIEIETTTSRYANKIDFTTDQLKLYALAQFDWKIISSNDLISGIALEYHYIHSNDFMDKLSYLYSEETMSSTNTISSRNKNINAQKLGYLTPSIFIQDEQRFWDDRIILTAGARLDAFKASYTDQAVKNLAPSWRAAALFKWASWMNMRLSYGHAFKTPSLYQLYVDTFDFVGVQDLKNEESEYFELSFLFSPMPELKIRFDTFFFMAKNLISLRFDETLGDPFIGTTGRYYPDQADDEKYRYFGGFEISSSYAINKNWDVYANYNFLYATTQANEEKTSSAYAFSTHEPMHRFRAGFFYMNNMLSSDVALFGVIPHYKDLVDPYVVFQPQVTVSLPSNLGLMMKASYAFSKGMTESPSWHYYYERRYVPVERYSFGLSLIYPFRK